VLPIVEVCGGEGLVIHRGLPWLEGPVLSSSGGWGSLVSWIDIWRAVGWGPSQPAHPGERGSGNSSSVGVGGIAQERLSPWYHSLVMLVPGRPMVVYLGPVGLMELSRLDL
jgi:hypothetical protein